jgi:hypothetical protein
MESHHRWIVQANRNEATLLEESEGDLPPFAFCRISNPGGNEPGKFAKRLAWVLNSLHERGDYDELVLIADPSLFGTLLDNLGHSAARSVVDAREAA